MKTGSLLIEPLVSAAQASDVEEDDEADASFVWCMRKCRCEPETEDAVSSSCSARNLMLPSSISAEQLRKSALLRGPQAHHLFRPHAIGHSWILSVATFYLRIYSISYGAEIRTHVCEEDHILVALRLLLHCPKS